MCSLSLRCFAGSLAVEQDCSTRRKETCTHPQKRTNTHTRSHTQMSVGGSPLTSARGLAPQMIKASGDREKQACMRRQMRKTNIRVSALTRRHEEEICTAVMLQHTKANKQLLISFQGEKKADPETKNPQKATNCDSGAARSGEDYGWTAHKLLNKKQSSTLDNRLTY